MQLDYGNALQTFGAKLPTPYIDQVRVHDDYHIVRLALYFEIPIEADEQEYLNSISADLGNVAIFQIVDGYVSSSAYGLLPHSGTVSGGRTSMAANILNNRYSILEMWAVNTAKFQLTETANDDEADLEFFYNNGVNATEIAVSEFEYCSTLETGLTKICKFIHEETIGFYSEGGTAEFVDFSALENYYLDYNLFCTLIPSDTVDLNATDYTEMFWSGESGGASGHRISTGLYTLSKASISNLTHQNILQTGSLSLRPVQVFMDSKGSVYNGQVIQSIDGNYYTDAKTSLETISTSISNLLLSSSNEEVKNAVNSISYILAQYGDSMELLPQLYSFYKVAPYKGAATEAGTWYENVSSQMFRFNESVTQAVLLKKELVTTPTLIDLRTTVLDLYEPPEPSDYSLVGDYIYGQPWNSLMHRAGYYDADRAYENAQQFNSNEEFTTFTKGFFFFDYEKALKTQSQISLMSDSDKIAQFFEPGVTNQLFRLKSVQARTYNRAAGATDSETLLGASNLDLGDYDFKMAIQTVYDLENDYTYPHALSSNFEKSSTDDSYKSSFTFADYTIGTEESTYYPYIYLRNWEPVKTDGLGGYRLMCFEYQQINTSQDSNSSAAGYFDNVRNDDFMTFQVVIEDTTATLVETLAAGYADVLTGSYTEYVEYASEFCSYNNIDNQFNDFFVQNIQNFYGDDDSIKPWFLAPLVYNLHLDLITNQFSGDQLLIVNEAKAMSARINPIGGSVEELQAFLELMTNFYNTYYSPGVGTLALIYEGLADVNTITFGGDPSGGAQNAYAPLPEVDFLNLIAYVPETEDVWIFDQMGSYSLEYGRYWRSGDVDEFNDGLSLKFSWPGDYGAADIVREKIIEWVDSDDRVKNVRKGEEISTGATVSVTYETYFVPTSDPGADPPIKLVEYSSQTDAEAAIESAGTELSPADGGNDWFRVKLYLSNPGEKSTGTVGVSWYRGQSYQQDLPDPADEDS